VHTLLDIQILVAGQFEFWGLSEGLQVKQHGPSFENDFALVTSMTKRYIVADGGG